MYFCVGVKKILPGFLTVMIIFTAAVCFAVNKLSYHSESVNAEEESIFVPVIMYHRLIKDPAKAGDYAVSPDVFKEDMQYLTDNGYTSVLVRDLLDYTEAGAPLPEKPVVITFDDGYYNVMEYALPYMKENNIKAVMNIVGAYTERSTQEDEHNPAYSYLTWDEISELDQSGLFEIGNHTSDMHSMTGRKGCKRLYNENAEEYREALIGDIGMLQDILREKSGVTPVTFAYPYGFISSESKAILEEIGFKALLTCYEKPNYISRSDTGECLMLNRYNRPSGISTEEFMSRLLSENQ
ncbi:MAG: polysaccharide deacetylase family protein [Oscillospiraceae bacterium]|nr:polysaccharide deacetylase family protein [Oscillospiraceae bacterium]